MLCCSVIEISSGNVFMSLLYDYTGIKIYIELDLKFDSLSEVCFAFLLGRKHTVFIL